MIRTATGTVKLASLTHARLDGLLEILRALQGQFFPYKIAGKLSGCVVQANSLTETRNSELDFERCRPAVQQILVKRQDKAYQRFLKQVGFSLSSRVIAAFAVSSGASRPFGASANARRFKSRIAGSNGYQTGAVNWVEMS